MIELDRLEALIENEADDISPVLEALPSLIRVARAAKLLLDASEVMVAHPEVDLTIDDWLRFGASINEVRPALAPLYREVES